MTNYKFTYFNATGLGEISRFLFAYGGIAYDDVRVSTLEEFTENVKNDLPYGLLPILEVDGKVVAQSLAIARFLATKVGMYGNNPWENLLIDEALGHIEDFRTKITLAYWDPDPIVKERKMVQAIEEHVPFYLSRFEALIEKNNYFALDRITLADLFFTSIQTYLNFTTETEVLKDYPNLRKLVDTVEALPGIKEWIEKRPEGMF